MRSIRQTLQPHQEELVDQEKTGYQKAYKWFGKQLEKTKGNSQMHQINSKISSKLPFVAKFDQTIFLTHEFLSPDVRPGHRYKSIPMLVVPKKKRAREKPKQTTRRKRRAEGSGFGGAPTGMQRYGFTS